MDAYARLRALLDVAESLGIIIRPAPRSVSDNNDQHPGGAVVRLKDQVMIFLDPTAAVADRTAVVVSALRGRPELSDKFLPPEIRELLDRD